MTISTWFGSGSWGGAGGRLDQWARALWWTCRRRSHPDTATVVTQPERRRYHVRRSPTRPGYTCGSSSKEDSSPKTSPPVTPEPTEQPGGLWTAAVVHDNEPEREGGLLQKCPQATARVFGRVVDADDHLRARQLGIVHEDPMPIHREWRGEGIDQRRSGRYPADDAAVNRTRR